MRTAFIRADDGQDLIEYALLIAVLGLVVVLAAISLAPSIAWIGDPFSTGSSGGVHSRLDTGVVSTRV